MDPLSEGYAVVPDCCSSQECAELLQEMSLVAGPGTRGFLQSALCQALAIKLRTRLSTAMPEFAALVAVQCTYFNKSADANWFVAWHQDLSVPVANTITAQARLGWSQKEGQTYIYGDESLLARMVAVRVHLDDSTADNGPLQVIAGSHSQGILSPADIAARISSRAAQSLLVSRGGAIVMRPLLLHASSKSRSGAPRRVLHYLFAPAQPPDGLDWAFFVGAVGRTRSGGEATRVTLF